MPHPIYGGDNSFVWDKTENIENELLVSQVVSTTQPMYHSRPVEDLPIITPTMELVIHPDNPFMAKDAACQIMTHGSCDFEFTWGKENPIPEEYTRAYSHYLKTIAPEEENTLEADFTEDGGYIRMYAEANGNVEEYSPFRPDWTLLADVRLNLHKKSSLICVLKLESEKTWDILYRDAQAGDTIPLKPIGTKTYFIFGNPVQKEGTTLEAFKPYKCSRSLEITCPEFTKIVRVHRQ